MPNTHNIFTKLVCHLHGEVPADTLEAYRRASGTIYDLLDQVERRRLECQADGLDPWTVPPATQAEMLCAWNAFVLQHLGDQFLDADYKENPLTVGYVPPITADQILTFYSQVEGWVSRAQQAHSNTGYKLDIAVPAELPAWSRVEPCPNTHLHAMLEAMRSVRDHAQAALGFLPDVSKISNPDRLKQAQEIHQLMAKALSKARYAEDLHGHSPTREVHERVEPFIKEAIETFYTVGQLISMPERATNINQPVIAPPQVTPQAAPQPPRPQFPMPGQQGFDPWMLTDPSQRYRLKRDPQAQQAIDELWRFDPNPAQTITIQNEIDAALARGDIQYSVGRNGARLGHFFCCPWGAVYVAVRPQLLGGQWLNTMQEFVFDVTAEGVRLGETFKRHIKIGVFQTTSDFEYGDPNAPADH